jgi:hypothetical protein
MFGIFGRRRRLTRDNLIALLSRLCLETKGASNFLGTLTPDARTRIGSPSRIEMQALDMWLVHKALIHSAGQVSVSDSQIQALVDDYHLDLYRRLLSAGYTDSALVTLQTKIRARYSEYNEALSGALAGDSKGPLRFAPIVTANLFNAEMDDPSLAAPLSLWVSAALFSTVDVLKGALADAKWD